MKTLLFVLIVLIVLFVACTETYIHMRTELSIQKRHILVFLGVTILICELAHFFMLGSMIVKIIFKEYDLNNNPKEIIVIDDYDRITGNIHYTRNEKSYIAEIASKEIELDYTDKDISTVTFYDAEYRVWVYTVPTTVCKIELGTALLGIDEE